MPEIDDKYNLYRYFFELPLYTKIDVAEEDLSSLLNLLNFSGRIDAYNPLLKENTTYSFEPSKKQEGYVTLRSYTGMIIHTIRCVRTSEKLFVCSYFDGDQKKITKNWTISFNR